MDVLLTFGLVVAYPLGPTAGFLFDFQPGVDVVLEEASREMSGRTNDGEVIWGKNRGGVFGVKQPMAVKSREPKKQ